MSRVYIKQIEVGPMENFAYLIGDREKKECFVIDPAWEVGRLIQAAQNDEMKIIGGICTHAHYDHVNGVDELIAKADVPVYMNKHDVAYVREAKSEFKKIDSEEILRAGEIEIKCLHTPGHTPGSQCLLVDDSLISGDTLFINGCGRCDLPGGDAATLFDSLQRLRKLDASVELMPGHNYAEVPTMLFRDVVETNPYLQFESREDFLDGRMRR